ncbi:dormancy-associated protein homolog 3-like [Phragmites australis]|uniref:dormancy-associated protein homolog 3-like n=1 Tax=Phragmites australis TaxID=29695 RepID=UPI002D77D32D|nr:dormancy-associated protein homolog 3-like [Phragmites australis]
MGLLDKLWDDTVAGPRPDTGLGRLRKQFVRPAAVKINDPAGDSPAFVPPSPASGGEETPVKVTRSIMIKRPAGYPASPRSAASTPPASPAGSTPPISPFAGAGRFRRKSSSDAYERATPGTTPPPFEV